MPDNDKEDCKKSGFFKWYGWGSPVGLSIFIVSCALVILLLALAGSLYIK